MIYRAINGLIRHAIEAELITNDDIFVVRNQLMDILKLTDWNDKEPLTGNIEELLEPLIDYAVKAGIIEDTAVQRDLFDTRVMVFLHLCREKLMPHFKENILLRHQQLQNGTMLLVKA